MARNTSKALPALAVIALVLTAGTMPVMGASPTVDTETTQTASTSELQEGVTINNFSASSSNASKLNISFTTSPDDPIVVEFVKGAGSTAAPDHSISGAFSLDTTVNGTEYYTSNISHDTLSTLPMAAGENAEYTVRVYEADDEENATSFNVTIDNSEQRTVIQVDEQTASDSSFVSMDSRYDFSLGLSPYAKEDTAKIDESAPVNASETNRTVTVVLADDNVSAASSNAAGNYDSGEWMTAHSALIEDEPVKVFKTNAPSNAPETHGVYSTDDGKQTVTYALSDNVSKSTVEVDTLANQNIPFSAFDVTDRDDEWGIQDIIASLP